MRRFYGIDLETLVALLNDEDILDIEPFSIDTSLFKFKPTKSIAFKKP